MGPPWRPAYYTGLTPVWQYTLAKRCTSTYNVAHGEVTELADVHDLGSCGVTRAGSSPAFPTTKRPRLKPSSRGRKLETFSTRTFPRSPVLYRPATVTGQRGLFSLANDLR